MLYCTDSTLASTKLIHCSFLVETKAFRKHCCRKQLDLYSKEKEKMIYCIFVLEGLEEFSGQALWFHRDKPALPVLN